MAFINPMWLWGLSALLVPIAIHLLSRKEGKIIALGSLRYLKDANTQQFKSLRLNELLLLLLRSVLIILLVLFLSGLSMENSTKQKWIVLEESLKANQRALTVADSLMANGYELHYLSPGFPVSVEKITSEQINYWALAEQLQSKALSEAVVISSGRAESFKGLRTQKPSSLRWINISPSAEEYVVSAIRTSSDSVLFKKGLLQNSNTHYTVESAHIIPNQKAFVFNADSIPISSRDTVRITLASNTDFKYDRQLVLAALNAIKATLPVHLIIDESNTDINKGTAAEWLIWLSEKALPAGITKQSIRYKNNPLTPLLSQETATTWILSKRLTEKAVVEESLSLQLAQLLISDSEFEAIADSKDQRLLPEQMIWSNSLGQIKGEINQAVFTPVDRFLILLLLIVLLTERLISYQRNQ